MVGSQAGWVSQLCCQPFPQGCDLIPASFRGNT